MFGRYTTPPQLRLHLRLHCITHLFPEMGSNVLTQFRTNVFPRRARLRWSFRSPAGFLRSAWSPARNSRGRNLHGAPFQTGIEPSQQDRLDDRPRRPRSYLIVGQPCLQVMRGYPIRIVRVSAVETLKRIPPPVVSMDKYDNGTRLRTIRRVDLLSTGTSRRRLSVPYIFYNVCV